LRFLSSELELEVEDHGAGFNGQPLKPGIGLVAMRERAELMGGRIAFSLPSPGGTTLRLTAPRENIETVASETNAHDKKDYGIASR
jgi:signal transduction histidine kinase